MANPIIPQLIAAREAQHLTRYALAKRIGCGRADLGRWEAGTHTPSLTSLEKWAAALGLTIKIEQWTT